MSLRGIALCGGALPGNAIQGAEVFLDALRCRAWLCVALRGVAFPNLGTDFSI